MPNVLSALLYTLEFPISYIPVLSSCCFSHSARRLPIVSESSAARNTLWYWEVSRERLHSTLYSHWCLGSEVKLQSSARYRLEMCWPKVPSFTGSRTVIHHFRTKAQEYTHAARLSSPPLPAHSTNPLGSVSHKSHVPVYTPPYIPLHTQAVCFFLPSRRGSSTSCPSTNRNLSYGYD